jgi:hypothetical protein
VYQSIFCQSITYSSAETQLAPVVVVVGGIIVVVVGGTVVVAGFGFVVVVVAGGVVVTVGGDVTGVVVVAVGGAAPTVGVLETVVGASYVVGAAAVGGTPGTVDGAPVAVATRTACCLTLGDRGTVVAAARVVWGEDGPAGLGLTTCAGLAVAAIPPTSTSIVVPDVATHNFVARRAGCGSARRDSSSRMRCVISSNAPPIPIRESCEVSAQRGLNFNGSAGDIAGWRVGGDR